MGTHWELSESKRPKDSPLLSSRKRKEKKLDLLGACCLVSWAARNLCSQWCSTITRVCWQ